jgi:putative Mg2+ transporter-C (MgtC) family protein
MSRLFRDIAVFERSNPVQALLQVISGFNPWSVGFRLLLAAFLGGCIGVERGRHGRPAGMRTYLLVCVGACLSTLLGQYCAQALQYNTDPLRIGTQVVSGIGFLGVGTIISDRNAHVTGLTTAAGLWTAACMGLAIGVGFYWGALMVFVIMLVGVQGLIEAVVCAAVGGAVTKGVSVALGLGRRKKDAVADADNVSNNELL